MQNFNIIKTVCPEKTFRVASVMGMFDMESNKIREEFTGEIALPETWRIGIIVGKSGTGKTMIAKHLFPDAYITSFDYSAETILDDMPRGKSIKDITKTFNSVGFSSPPSWLKPYSVLSNGEKMRVDLARAILSDMDLFVFDEFTSVVDRNVAKIGSLAMQKAIRKTSKKMIAVTCHVDVIDWLLPDWIFDTDTMTFHSLEGQKKNKPELKLEIFQAADKSIWKVFARYHYLAHYHNNAATVYVAYLNGELCGFYSVLKFVHRIVKNAYRGHRLVILPDYQGIGVGGILRTAIAEMYVKKGFRFMAVTSHPALIFGLKDHPNWRVYRYARAQGGNGPIQNKAGRGATSHDRITAGFEYVIKMPAKYFT